MLSPLLPLFQESLHHENSKEFRVNLNNVETALQDIRSRRQTHTWIETSTEVLTYLGYVAQGMITLYGLYKIGFSNLLSQLAPKNLCIRLFCVNTTVNTMPTVHYTEVATATPLISNSVTPIDLSARLTDNTEVEIVLKRVKLRT